MNKTDPRIRKTKLAIRSALFELMQKKNISDITISEVTSLANLNRKSFYNHYRNLQDVLCEYQDEYITGIFSNINFPPHNSEDYYFSSIDILYAIIAQLQKDDELLHFIYECNEYVHFFSLIGEHIKKLALESPKRHINQKYFDLYVDFITGGISSIFKTVYEKQSDFSTDNLSLFLEKCIQNKEVLNLIFNSQLN